MKDYSKGCLPARHNSSAATTAVAVLPGLGTSFLPAYLSSPIPFPETYRTPQHSHNHIIPKRPTHSHNGQLLLRPCVRRLTDSLRARTFAPRRPETVPLSSCRGPVPDSLPAAFTGSAVSGRTCKYRSTCRGRCPEIGARCCVPRCRGNSFCHGYNEVGACNKSGKCDTRCRFYPCLRRTYCWCVGHKLDCSRAPIRQWKNLVGLPGLPARMLSTGVQQNSVWGSGQY